MSLIERLSTYWQDSLNFLLGAVLFFSPWLFGFEGEQTASLNAYVVGGIIAVMALMALFAFQTWEDVVSGLHLGEGIETCLAARQLGFQPTWAMGSAGAISTFPVLAGIEAISVLMEGDRASHDAARAVAARYEPTGAEVYAFEAEAGDINDALRRVAA